MTSPFGDGLFNASEPPPDEPDVRDELREARSREALTNLERAMGRVDEVVARIEASEPDELDPQIVELLEEVTGRDDAPLEFASLNRRVRDGFTTWRDFWRRPQAEAGGMRLLGEVMRLQMARIASIPREDPDAEPDTPPARPSA